MADSEPLVASSMRVFCVRNSQREGRSRPREGRDHLFQWDVGISVGFSAETTGSLRNPETRRTPSPVSRMVSLGAEVGDDPPDQVGETVWPRKYVPRQITWLNFYSVRFKWDFTWI